MLSSGSIISFLCLAPNTFTAIAGVATTLSLTGLAYFISLGWVTSKTNEWLLIIENGLLKKAGVGLKTFKWYTQTAVTFPSTIQGVNFRANQVTKENFGIEIEGIVFWAVNRDADGPFKCYKYTQGSDANENVQQVTESIVRSFISNTTLMDVLRKRVELREQITKALQKQLFGWGIWPETVEITEVKISSNTLFKDMQTEFRFKHKQLAKNSKQQSKQVLEEEQSKYSLEKDRVYNQKQTDLEKFRLEQEIMRNNFISEFEEKSIQLKKQNMILDNELKMVKQERQNNYSLQQAKNDMEINKLKHDFEQQEKKEWEAVYDKMNERNMEKLEIDKTSQAYSSSYIEGFYVNKYIGPENIQNISSLMPAVNMVNQMNKQ